MTSASPYRSETQNHHKPPSGLPGCGIQISPCLFRISERVSAVITLLVGSKHCPFAMPHPHTGHILTPSPSPTSTPAPRLPDRQICLRCFGNWQNSQRPPAPTSPSEVQICLPVWSGPCLSFQPPLTPPTLLRPEIQPSDPSPQ